jgi:hypothetical protein
MDSSLEFRIQMENLRKYYNPEHKNVHNNDTSSNSKSNQQPIKACTEYEKMKRKMIYNQQKKIKKFD